MDPFPDLGSLSDEELKDLIQQLSEQETEISYRRRMLHGRIDILRAELVSRLRRRHGEAGSAVSGSDVSALSEILAERLAGPPAGPAPDPAPGPGFGGEGRS